MSQKEHLPKRHRLTGCKSNSGSFVLNGTSNPTTLYGRGFNVAYMSTGKWRVTFDGPYLKIVNVVAHPMGDTATAAMCQVVSCADGPNNAASFVVKYLEQDAGTKDFLVANHVSGDAVRVCFEVDFDDQGAH